LADVPPLGEVRDLAGEALLVDADLADQLADGGAETVAFLDEASRRAVGDDGERGLDRGEPLLQIGLEASPLVLPHPDGLSRGRLGHGADVSEIRSLRLGLVAPDDDVRIPC